MVLLHTIVCLIVFLLLGAATETDTASSKGSARKEVYMKYDEVVQQWKSCNFPDPSLYVSPSDSSNRKPMLELCHTEDDLGDKPDEDKLFRFKLCQRFYSLSLLMCTDDTYQEFRSKCLHKEALINVKPFNDSNDVCTALSKYPPGYKSFTSFFNSSQCKKNCGNSENSMKDICELHGTVLHLYRNKCPNPQGSANSKPKAGASSDRAKSTSDALTTLPTPKGTINIRDTTAPPAAPPADLSSGAGKDVPAKTEIVTGGKVPAKTEIVTEGKVPAKIEIATVENVTVPTTKAEIVTVGEVPTTAEIVTEKKVPTKTEKSELLPADPGPASVADSSMSSPVSGSVTKITIATPKPKSEPPQDNEKKSNPATPESQHFQPANQDKKDDDKTDKTNEDGTLGDTNDNEDSDGNPFHGHADDDDDNFLPSNTNASENGDENPYSPDDDDDNVPPTNTNTSPDKSPSNSINKDKEDKGKSTSNTENANSPSATDNDKNTSQQKNENTKASDVAKEKPNKKANEKQGKNKNADGSAEIIDKGTDASIALSDPDSDESPGSGHFLAYFLTAVVICITGYVIYHNKQKIMAFIIEGRNSGRGGRQRSKDVKYSQLKSNVEEVLPSLEQTATSKNFIY